MKNSNIVKQISKKNVDFKNLMIISSIILALVLLLSVCFATFATELDIGSLASIVRIQKDIRVGGVSVSNSANGGVSNWEDYNVSSILGSIRLPNANSTVTYSVPIVNLGNVEAGITSITGLPSNLTYSISNYNLNSTLCDDTNSSKCKLGSISTLDITIGYAANAYDSNNTTFTFNMDFEFFFIDAVARIGSVYCPTLADAISRVPTDGTPTTVVLLKDSSELIEIAASQNVILDLDGVTLSDNGANNVIRNYGTLRITNGRITSSIGQGAINNYGTLYMSGGRIEATGTRQAIYNDGGTVEISGTAYLSNTTKDRAAVQNQVGTVRIIGGTIVSKLHAAVDNRATLVVGVQGGGVDSTTPVLQGGTFGITSTKAYSFYDGISKGISAAFNNENIITKESGYGFLKQSENIGTDSYETAHLAIVNVITFDPNGGTIAASDATRNVESGEEIGALPIPEQEGFVFDGWFTSANGGTEITRHLIVNSSETYYAHWTDASQAYVAMIGETGYNSLQAAITASPANTQTTILLLRDVREVLTVGNSKNIIINMQNHSLTNSGSGAVIENNGRLEIGNGIIDSASNAAAINNNNGATFLMTSGEIHATGSRQAIYNFGTATIGGTAYLSSMATGKPTGSSMDRATINNLSTGTLNITGGTIVGIYQAAVTNEGTLNLGTQGGTVSTTDPVLMGDKYGLETVGTFNYYDGIIKGRTGPSPISGTVTSQETGTQITIGSEVINSKSYYTVTLN